VSRPVLLDLYSGAGGAAAGYHRAGWDVIGVDIKAQPRYPYQHHVGDALALLPDLLDRYQPAAIHASPPCQAYSVATVAARNRGVEYPDLVAATRGALDDAAVPYVIENVPRSPVRPDVVLCGCQWPDALPGLRRQRWFELGRWAVAQLRPPCHHPGPIITVVEHGPGPNQRWQRTVPDAEWMRLKQAAMGIDWMNRRELGQAIPPAYTEWIGAQLLDAVRAVSS
jgi:DNA (cytosine-5)-methyltransferase 1